MGNSSSTKKNQSKCPFINNETSPPLSKANDEIKLIWTPDIKPLKLRNYQTGEIAEVTGPITNKYNDCRQHVCTSTYMPLTTHPHQTQIKTENSINEFESLDENYVKKEAHNFLSIYHNDMKTSENDYEKRLKQVNLEIEKTGTYIHKTDELEYGCQLAWRNSSRCINRLYWRTFKALDHRNIRTNDEMFKAICDHIHFAYNGGTLQASVLIMNPKSRVWSSQYFRYACYEQSDGSLLGDPANLELTKIAIQVGWNKIEEKRTQWDLLPIIVQVEPNEDPSWYELPDDLQFQVFLSHPDKKYDTAIKSLGLRWFAQPYVSEKAIEVGGIFYRCVPFSGWFMETEIGRNLCDIQRYNFIPKLADLLDMDITAAANSQLNIDRLYVEINASILYSFEKAKIAIVDHHTAATGFMKFMKAEIKQRGNTPCDWVWIVPPISSGMSSVFHQEMLNYVVKPRVVDQNEPWLNYTPMKKHKDLLGIPLNKRIRHRWLILRAARVIIGFALVAVKQRISVNVLYASSSGTAYSYAQQMYKQLLYIGYNPLLNELDSFKFLQHNNERSINLIITSTFGQGNASDGGIKLEEWLKNPEKTFGKNSNEDKLISTMRSPLMWCTYAVCAIGSSAYPFYCGFGKLIDDTFEKLGGTRLIPFTMCDALNQQFKSYNQWETIAIHTLRSIYPHACLRPEILSTSSINTNISPGQEVNLNNSFRSDYNSLEFYPEKIKIQQNQSEEKGVFTKDKPYIATVIQNIELIENEDKSSNIDNEHSVRLIVFDTCGLSYLPGDHVCILPENSLTNINNLLLACDWKIDDERLDQHCSLSSFTNNKYNTIREILTYYIDLNITPKPHVLNTISIYAKDENEQRNILELGIP
ncbi:unnamed protein product [Adineta steineri]|uniref:nitric-oxide synthase (NADPH) n=1 Tax=Adineta steineri TaxID=433720 RepID=A0A815CL47_9BILA|nr:unnamed protein product [Adineta steineri]CAF1566527.1 unnamed protein product [Adineta steineri]